VEVESLQEHNHIHLPNPSLWPLILSGAMLLVIAGLLALPDVPWLSIVAAPFVLISILGWALEDPMAAAEEQLVAVPVHPHTKYALRQEVVDKNGTSLGMVQARFDNYILVGEAFVKPYYVPLDVINDNATDDIIRLTVSEAALLEMGLESMPDDLYNEMPEPEVPQVNGVPLFARRPLSPAQTGHYNYGPNYPGINTDASGSYPYDEVRPVPQRYVSVRRKTVAII
jgi:hypothetical protein